MGSKGTNSGVVIKTALITAISSIAIAFIGIVPIFYKKKVPAPVEPEKCFLSGEITSGDGKPMKNAEVYLIRSTGSDLMATADDNGKFIFQGLPDDSYWVIVRDNVSEKASRVLIGKKDETGEIEVVESILKYTRRKE